MNHFVHCCSFSTSNTITSKGCQSASQTCDFDAKMQIFSGEETPPPHAPPHPLGASILTPPILNFCHPLPKLPMCTKFGWHPSTHSWIVMWTDGQHRHTHTHTWVITIPVPPLYKGVQLIRQICAILSAFATKYTQNWDLHMYTFIKNKY